MNFGKPLLLALLAGAAQGPLHAQQVIVPPPEESAPEAPADTYEDLVAEDETGEADGEEIVVTGTRLRGAVVGDIPPEVQLDARDIRAYGAGSLTELLDALSPQTRSGRGRGGERPVVLLNGKRISGFSEIRDIPPEAIERVDILPEEVALRYGYRADQRVVNFVLRERFRAVTGELEYGLATAGGRGRYETDLNILRIDRAGRWSLDFEYEHAEPLFESERDLIQSPAPRPFDLAGNILAATPGGEIDPALSALVGVPVTVAGVPATAAQNAPLLGDFVAGANNAHVTDLGRYRTLLPKTDQFSIAGTINRTLFGDVSATLNARLEESQSESRFGLPTATLLLPAASPYSPFAADATLYRYVSAPGALARESYGRTGHVGLGLNGDIAPWRWSFTANWDRASNESATDTGVDLALVQARLNAADPTFNPFGALAPGLSPRDANKSVDQSVNAELVANGTLLALPAGEIAATVKAGFETRDFESETLRSGLVQLRDLGRDRTTAQANIDLPIASRRRDFLGAIGDLSANFNATLEHYSDFGTLRSFDYGLNWSPIEEVRLIASVTDEEGAPSVQQLGNPVVLTPNVRVFDFLRGETVDIARLEGGNPDLVADNRRVIKLGLTARPWEEKDLTFSANYTANRIRNPIASFPTATAEIEAAFPERFLRDVDGTLLRIDSRPVNFERSDREEIRWGINFSKPISQSVPARRPGAAAGRPGAAVGQPGERPAGGWRGGAGRGQGGGGRGFGGRGFGGGGPQGGRLQLSFYHTWHLEDSIRIRDGVPELDLLNGSAVGNRGGRPEHELELQAGIFKNGLGARLSGNWQSGTFVRGAPGSDGDLFFSDLATLNLRLFADLGQQRSLVREHRWLRGTRVSLGINNLLDSRLEVRDANGVIPLGYQPDYLDPLGRSVTLSIRKLFF